MEQQSQVRLTALSSKGGCGCKIGPADLSQVLRQLPKTEKHPDLLVGLDTSDDAGVFRLNDDLALVQTVDFFTPIVDDPYSFGQVAAANALSDIYAMGGKPLTALNIVAFPIATLDKSVLADILRGLETRLPRRERRWWAATRSMIPSRSSAWLSPAPSIRTGY